MATMTTWTIIVTLAIFPGEIMTIAELDALLERYFPSKQPEMARRDRRQGRAGVTKPQKPICPVCKHSFVKEGHAVRQKYCSRSCQQRAYRQRKKAAA